MARRLDARLILLERRAGPQETPCPVCLPHYGYVAFTQPDEAPTACPQCGAPPRLVLTLEQGQTPEEMWALI